MSNVKVHSLVRFVSMFLCVLMLLPSISYVAFAVEGGEQSQTQTQTQENQPQEPPTVKTGVVKGTNVYVRSGPGTGFAQLTHNGYVFFLQNGHELQILQENVAAQDSNTLPWHQVSFTYSGTPYSGYIRSDLVTLSQSTQPEQPPVVPDTPVLPDVPETPTIPFEEQLASFPESYRAALTAIHERYPNWNFEVFNTNLDWNVVQENENVLGRSLTDSKIVSYYSTAAGCYDWYTDTYFPLEAGRWFQAAPQLVAYYMDPRNFLNENDLFMFEMLSFSGAYQTEAAVESMLAGTFMEGKTLLAPDGTQISYAKLFYLAAYNAGVSPFHLVTRCIQEVGRQGTGCSLGTYPGYEGYYNFFSIGANTGATAGMQYAKNKGWNSPYKAVVEGAKFIGGNYLECGQNTPYFQKFSVVNPEHYYWKQYMTNIAAAFSEGHIQRGEYEKMGYLSGAITFRIPVYNNMPTEPCPHPTAAGSPNNLLTGLWVDGYSLTPTFDFYSNTTDFALIITGSVSSIHVYAAAASKGATVSGSVGNVKLSPGENKLNIICTSAAGTQKTYTITVIYNETEPPPPGTDTPAGPENPPSPPTTEQKNATVRGTEIQVRVGPGTNYGRLSHNGITILLNEGHSLVVKGEAVPGEDGNSLPWYRVTFSYSGTSYEGYMRSDFVNFSSGNPDTPQNPDPQPVPSGWNHSYRIEGNVIAGLTPGMDVSRFLTSLGAYGNARTSLYDANGSPVSSGSVRTGLKLIYFDGTHTTELVLVLYGDPNRDAAVDAIDLLLVRRYLLGLTALEGADFRAADANHDGKVDAIDLLLIRRYLLGLSEIKQ